MKANLHTVHHHPPLGYLTPQQFLLRVRSEKCHHSTAIDTVCGEAVDFGVRASLLLLSGQLLGRRKAALARNIGSVL